VSPIVETLFLRHSRHAKGLFRTNSDVSRVAIVLQIEGKQVYCAILANSWALSAHRIAMRKRIP
jgi:hypothetical protein